MPAREESFLALRPHGWEWVVQALQHNDCRKGEFTMSKILILWPESQRIMAHPEAVLDLNIPDESSAYWIPEHIWEKYENSYYQGEEEE